MSVVFSCKGALGLVCHQLSLCALALPRGGFVPFQIFVQIAVERERDLDNEFLETSEGRALRIYVLQTPEE